VLVTGWDIIFFWVARMIFAGYEFKNERPFNDVYFTGMVRDKQRRKMSKSLGNSPDAIELMDRFGADGVRFGMLSCAAAGNDLLFDESLCEQGKNFCNKLWNAFKLVKGWEIDNSLPQPESAKIGNDWLNAKLSQTINTIEDQFSKYRLSDALMDTYKLIWDDFCSSYLEIVKPAYQQPIDQLTYQQTVGYFEQILTMLHPFMPFVTEELWQNIETRKDGESLMMNAYPKTDKVDESLIEEFNFAMDVITEIRTLRKQKNIANKDQIELFVKNNQNTNTRFDCIISKLTNLSNLTYVDDKIDGAFSFVVKSNEYFIPMSENIDVEAEKEKIKKELDYTLGFLNSVNKKLANEKFVNNAPEQVLAVERKKQAEAESKIKVLEEQLLNFA
jgi:valyl-tRNA synthetase